MFSSFIAKIATNTAMIAAATQLISLENKQKGTNEFYCGTFENEYAIRVVTPSGTKPLSVIGSWASASGWTPRKRCQTIADRFQKYYDRGILGFMTTGEVNSHPVICVVGKTEASCNEDNVLITLEKSVSAEASLSGLNRSSPSISSRSGSSDKYMDGHTYTLKRQLNIPDGSNSILFENGRYFFDIEKLIEESPVDSDTDWRN